MHTFYSTEIRENFIELNEEESRHLAKVLRMKEGDEVAVIDGMGNQFTSRVVNAHPKKSSLQIIHRKHTIEQFHVSIAAAPTKNLNRWEWFLEKATEIGIDAIIPITTCHSERKVLKRDRQERILVGAMKQSHKSTLPKLNDLSAFHEVIEKQFDGEKYIAHCHEDYPREFLHKIYPKGNNALILIGPEGDFSKEEVEEALRKGFKSVALSNSRLRTETAALIACQTINLYNA